eukprot:5204051-Prorocentrum_lima.AAC.1
MTDLNIKPVVTTDGIALHNLWPDQTNIVLEELGQATHARQVTQPYTLLHGETGRDISGYWHRLRL